MEEIYVRGHQLYLILSDSPPTHTSETLDEGVLMFLSPLIHIAVCGNCMR